MDDHDYPFKDNVAFGTEFKRRMIVLDVQNIPRYVPPPPRPRGVIPGFTFLSEDSPRTFNGVCRSCGGECGKAITTGSWSYQATCSGCGALHIVNEGDKMGGQFDTVECYVNTPLKVK